MAVTGCLVAIVPAKSSPTSDIHERNKTMGILDVSKARLYYETHGSGPLLLMIPGANGDARAFAKVTEPLAKHYTVAIYDRRGFSRSLLDGPQDYNRRLEADADDAYLLIEHLGNGQPATVFGTSSGGIVALQLLTRRPSAVRTLVPYEPPVTRQLPDGQQWADFFFQAYATYVRSGMEPAMKMFRERAFTESDQRAMAQATNPADGEQVKANAVYWFEHELRQYPIVDLDLDTIGPHADQVVPMVGRESRGRPSYQATVELGRKLGQNVIELPGGHVGFLTHPDEFARELVQALARQ
jgi:pimeloyl-ACP methyl ester carboxylesterase